MRDKIFLIPVLILLWINSAKSQNNSCTQPDFICFNDNTIVIDDAYNFSIPGSTLCNPDPLKLYYFFDVNSTSSFINLTCLTGMEGYKLWGPFSASLANACAAFSSTPYSFSTSAASSYTLIPLASGPGIYYLEVEMTACIGTLSLGKNGSAIYDCTEDELPCENCIGSFAPQPDKTYLLSAWVKEDSAPLSKTSFNYPQINLDFPNVSTTLGPYSASGQIIDGWQRVEQEFTIPTGANQIDIKLSCATGDCFFDDIRIFPYDGSMKSYVYDPVTLRLVAELDERNYATMYEYDEEGKLVRIKKETERGIMTIQESKTNVVKK